LAHYYLTRGDEALSNGDRQQCAECYAAARLQLDAAARLRGMEI
jgi:hypothetical protein